MSHPPSVAPWAPPAPSVSGAVSGPPPRTSTDLRAGAAGPLARRLSAKYLDEHCLIPLTITDTDELLVAAGAPLDPTVLDELAWTYERAVRLVDAPAAEVHAAIMSAQSR